MVMVVVGYLGSDVIDGINKSLNIFFFWLA